MLKEFCWCCTFKENFLSEKLALLVDWLGFLCLSVFFNCTIAGTFCFLFSFFKDLFIYGRTESSLLCLGFLQQQWAGTTLAAVPRLLTASSFSRCRAWALGRVDWQLCPAGPRAQVQWLWSMGPVALWHVESSWTRDWTHVPCIGMWILIHCTTREALLGYLWYLLFLSLAKFFLLWWYYFFHWYVLSYWLLT